MSTKAAALQHAASGPDARTHRLGPRAARTGLTATQSLVEPRLAACDTHGHGHDMDMRQVESYVASPSPSTCSLLAHVRVSASSNRGKLIKYLVYVPNIVAFGQSQRVALQRTPSCLGTVDFAASIAGTSVLGMGGANVAES